MSTYETQAYKELKTWQKNMLSNPSLMNRLAKRMQNKINRLIPEKLHKALTSTIKQMVRAVLFGSGLINDAARKEGSLELREAVVQEKIKFYRKTAAIEGGVTGAGGILLGLADFPILLGLKLKMLFDIASVYGFNTGDYKERLYLLHIFQLAFSSQEQRRKVYLRMIDWDDKKLPEDINQFDWRTFQQEYRDYIDLAKLAQLIPIIGAPVGFVINYRLLKKLGQTAIYAYRMRLIKTSQ